VAGKSSKFPGTINVTDGKPFGQNVWYGRVDQAGPWTISPKLADEVVVDQLYDLLVKLSEDPPRPRRPMASSPGIAASACFSCTMSARSRSGMARCAPSAGACHGQLLSEVDNGEADRAGYTVGGVDVRVCNGGFWPLAAPGIG
jgi:hypothetical protein